MTDSFTVLQEIRKYYRIVGSPLSLIFIHERLRKRLKLKSKQIGGYLRELHKMGRIKFVDNRIIPQEEIKDGSVDANDIKDILLDLRRAKPSKAYQHFLDKFNTFVNPETFTRLMRKMAQDGDIKREGEYYYLKKDFQQKRLV